MRKTILTLMAAASLTIVANAEPTLPLGNVTVDTSRTFIEECLQQMGSSSMVVANGAFVSRTLAGHTYWVAKAVFSNGTEDQVTMGVVISPDDNWTKFMYLTDFGWFMKTGRRDLLGLPDLNVDPEPEPVVEPHGGLRKGVGDVYSKEGVRR